MLYQIFAISLVWSLLLSGMQIFLLQIKQQLDAPMVDYASRLFIVESFTEFTKTDVGLKQRLFSLDPFQQIDFCYQKARARWQICEAGESMIVAKQTQLTVKRLSDETCDISITACAVFRLLPHDPRVLPDYMIQPVFDFRVDLDEAPLPRLYFWQVKLTNQS